VHDEQVRVIPMGKEPTASWQVQMLDSMAELKRPAARAFQDSNVYAKEAIAPGLPNGVKAHIQNQTVPSDAKRVCLRRLRLGTGRAHHPRPDQREKGDAGYYKYEETKLHPTDQKGNNTMRWLMLEQGFPVRKAWQEYIKHWDQIHIGMLGMVGGAGRFTPRHMAAAHRVPPGRNRSAPVASAIAAPGPVTPAVAAPSLQIQSWSRRLHRQNHSPGRIPQWAKKERS